MYARARATTIAAMKTAPVLAVALTLALPAAAGADTIDYKIVEATHTSSATKHDEHVTMTSHATWSLAKASKFRLQIGAAGLFAGLGRVNVRGAYDIDASTDWPGHCAFTARTGDQEHPAVAPAPFDLTAQPAPKRPGMAMVGFIAAQATVTNAYLGTECATSAAAPGPTVWSAADVPLARLKGKSITLKYAGRQTDGEGVTYDWKTEIVLKRAKVTKA
jgi:hypothetical protein